MNELDRKCEAILKEGGSIDSVLSLLRQNGYSRVKSIKAIMRLTNSSLAEAKNLVHLSPTWRDVREETERFHDLLLDPSNDDACEG